ncbi:MAG TPA: DUF2203 domain-containing protein [Holophagaceae bacterium]|nr:DUF2203 domain-containing protein [Holophagaceae bacterium]
MSRVFSLEEAKGLMPEVKRLTEPVYLLAASLAEEVREAEEGDDATRQDDLKERLQTLVQSWSDSIQDLGADVKGLWLVDFDSGDGYWCWAYPEAELDHWHSYEGGFGARVPVAEKPVKA